MAKKQRPADQPIDPNAAAVDGDQPVSSDVAPAENVNAISMEDFITRADRADWLSVAEAAEYINGKRDADDTSEELTAQKMRNAANNRAEFKADGAKLAVKVPGYSITPLTYLHRSAVDLYQSNNASGNTRAARVIANGKRWIIRVKEENRADVIATLAPFGITLEIASAPHKKDNQPSASAEASADPNAETQAANAADQTAPLGGYQGNGVNVWDQPHNNADVPGDLVSA